MGNLKHFFFSILLLVFGCLTPILAAPAQWGIAINETQQQCAGYWAGDEFSIYSLPQGWKSYVPEYGDENFNAFIDTPYGRCDFSNYSEEDCCLELGLPYISDQIGEYSDSGLCLDCYEATQNIPSWAIIAIIICCCLSLIILIIVPIIILLKRSKKSK